MAAQAMAAGFLSTIVFALFIIPLLATIILLIMDGEAEYIAIPAI